MGTYDTETFMELFGGLPERGEAHPSLEQLDNLRKAQKEDALTASPEPAVRVPPPGRVAGSGGGTCGCCGAPKDAPCSPTCETNR